MSQVTIRNLVIFLLINAIVAIYIVTNYFIKDEVLAQPTPTPIVAQTRKPSIAQAVVAAGMVEPQMAASVEHLPASLPIHEKTLKDTPDNAPVATKITEPDNKICVEMGPFNDDEKNTMDFILNKNKQANLAKVEKLFSQQLYWNLGKNKAEADRLFNKQKEGAMADPKFVLSQNNNKEWVVNITKVHGTDIVAKSLLKDLAEKAQKINTGGTWDYSNFPEGYFYKFSDYKSLKEVTVNSIDVMLKPRKDPC